MDAKEHLWFDGADSDFIYFSVRSRSRGGGGEPLRHTVAICKRTGFISCLCEDHLYRCKGSRIDDPNPYLCYHCRAIMQWAGQLVGAMFGKSSKLRRDD